MNIITEPYARDIQIHYGMVETKINGYKITFTLHATNNTPDNVSDWRTGRPGFIRIGGKLAEVGNVSLKRGDINKWLENLDIKALLISTKKLAKNKMIRERDRLNKKLKLMNKP